MAEKALAIDYSSLAPTTEIRILTLDHGRGDDPIVCALRPVMRDGAKYHALSYEWEDESNNDPFITISDRQVQIRMNLFEALKNIRKSTEDLQLWVDAICINQSNVQEKSQQVAMMGEIFTEAVGVISWLGPARDDSNLAMYLMRFGITPEPDSRELKALLSLCYRRYWRRVWIIQELYLAKSYVVWCGHKSISDSKFETSLANLNGYNMFSDEFSQSPANQHSMARLFRSTEINNLHRWISVCIRADFQCTKEQDIIYALLDISTDYQRVKGSFKVDYSKTPRDVFLELLCQRDLSTWRRGEENRWLELAKRMKLSIDEELRSFISEEVNI
ncbi:heterokaryon incompatibility het-6 [Fusarium mexicanum]|uniref:Heterokaryon incompatibility het-6 n=1 Tax=Fusarium mexicanum TaxID=751941 RepID=A0A8H5IWJ5_9HYPO|nr:heterokaryon incompatibility het-6 [Fusarium mexicanum]